MATKIIRILDIIRAYLSPMILYSCAILVIILVLLVFTQVMFRFIFKHPFAWAEEVARYVFIWTSILGAVLGIEKRAHFSMDFIAKSLKPKAQKNLDIFLRIVIGTFLVLLTYHSIDLTIMAGSQLSPALNMPLSYLFVILPFGFAAMCLFLLFSGVLSIFQGEA